MSEHVVALLQRAQNDQHFQAEVLRATPHELLALGLKPGQQAVLLSNLLLTSPFQSGDLPDWDARYGHAFPTRYGVRVERNRNVPLIWIDRFTCDVTLVEEETIETMKKSDPPAGIGDSARRNIVVRGCSLTQLAGHTFLHAMPE